ncbi:MAG TPA: thiol peroxidase [Anaerolineales bacterium]|nr:thiol peroxidase [Anaerolineales bacterium]
MVELIERFGLIKHAGADVTVVGADVKVGQQAPEFVAVAQNWSEQMPLQATKGKVRLLAAVPSLDTSVCDRETRRFNEEAVHLGEDVHIFVISTDLPFAQKRWCGAAGVDRVTTLSDHLHADFGQKYGCLIKERRILRRAVFVVDRKDQVSYVDYMPVLGDEPKYDEVIGALRSALG